MHAHRGDVFASLAARPRNLIAAGHEDCNDADHLKVNPALRLALDKKYKNGGGPIRTSRFENNILVTGEAPNPEDG